MKALAKEKDLLEREKWELRRQAKEATDHAGALRSQLDLKDNRMKELEAELSMVRPGRSGSSLPAPLPPDSFLPPKDRSPAILSPPPQAKQSLATLTKDVPKRHSLAMPGETVLNGNQEWVMQADLPLTAAIRQSQQTLYHAHPQHTMDRQGESRPFSPTPTPPGPVPKQTHELLLPSFVGRAGRKPSGLANTRIARESGKAGLPCISGVRVSPCHSRQPSIISDASAAEGDRSSTPSDINSPRHRTHSLCNVRRVCRSLAVPHSASLLRGGSPLPLACRGGGIWWEAAALKGQS